MSKGKRTITQAIYSKLLEAFRDAPGNFTRAGRFAGVNARTAKRAWMLGWPDKPGMLPIQDVLKGEAELARARLAGDEMADGARRIVDREKARQQAVESREEEGRMVMASRKLTMQTQMAYARIVPGLHKLMERVNTELSALASDQQNFKLHHAMQTLRRATLIVHDVTAAGREAMEMERLFLGEPTQIVGLSLGDVDDMTLEECVAEIEQAATALQRAKKLDLHVLDGGKSNGTNGANGSHGTSGGNGAAAV